MSAITIEPSVLDINLYNRDSIDMLLILKTSSAAYVTLPASASNILWKSQVRNNTGSVVANFILTPSATNLTNGELTMYLAPVDLSSYTGLEYDLQVSYVSNSSSFTHTYLKGSITVTEDVTQ